MAACRSFVFIFRLCKIIPQVVLPIADLQALTSDEYLIPESVRYFIECYLNP